MSYRALAVLIVLAAACNKAKSAAPGGGPGGGMPPMPVEVSAAIRDTVVDAVQASGQIEPVQSIELRPEVQGRITEILVPEGQQVEAGTALFKVDDAELKAQVAQAVLAGAEELARAAQFKIQFGNLEAVGGANHGVEAPFAGLGNFLAGQQEAIRFGTTAADASAKLM